MTKSNISRRTFIEGGVGLTVVNFIPGTTPLAFAASLEERTVTAAKAVGAADVSGMIWSPYLVPMQPVIAEFKKQTGIGVGGVQDISIFDAPQRVMAEALSRSPQFDFIHIDSNMIPSLASAGYLEPLDDYMRKADFKIEAVADYANFMTYKGHTYGIPTDGNVHIHYLRKDLVEDADNKKRFADKHGKELKYPETWEDDLRIQQTLMDPAKDLVRVRQLAQSRQRPDLVVHDLLQRRRVHVRRRHESNARHAGRTIRRRHLPAGQEDGASGIGRLGHATDDPAHCAGPCGQLPVLGRHRQAE